MFPEGSKGRMGELISRSVIVLYVSPCDVSLVKVSLRTSLQLVFLVSFLELRTSKRSLLLDRMAQEWRAVQDIRQAAPVCVCV